MGGARARGGHLPSLGLWFFLRGEGAYLACLSLSFLWVSLGSFWGMRLFGLGLGGGDGGGAGLVVVGEKAEGEGRRREGGRKDRE